MTLTEPERITSFRTSDGKLWENLQEANAAQSRLNLYTWADECSLGSGGSWDAGMIVDVMLENAVTLQAILTNYLSMRRPLP